MSPSIFRAVVIDPLGDPHADADADGDRNVRNVLTDWKTCKKKKIRTNEGGYVYFYPIRKTSHFLGGKLNKVDERGERGNN